MTGMGKSSFIEKVAAQGVKVGHDLKSCTSKIQEVKCKVGSYNVNLVDTPGFGDTYRSDTEILELIAEWMQTSYDSKTLLSGIIYIHSISDRRMLQSSVQNLAMFRKLCGAKNFSNVVLVTTMWDQVDADMGKIRESQLCSDFWELLISDGATVKRHYNSSPSATEIILQVVKNNPMVLTIQEEMSKGATLAETEAGACINEDLIRLQKEHETKIAAVKEEMKLAMEQGNKILQQGLEKNHARIIADMEKNADDQRRLHERQYEALQAQIRTLQISPANHPPISNGALPRPRPRAQMAPRRYRKQWHCSFPDGSGCGRLFMGAIRGRVTCPFCRVMSFE
ncbi:hypothetical protein BDZ45DRAFT_590027 [Acephala macrosclerotiorum]|nr:hypothetical protein BDZ45DRAFT_590027 [Acephala macrosclerotiorum]